MGRVPDRGEALNGGRAPRAFTLRSDAGLEAVVLDWGATLARLRAPDRDGRVGDVVLGFDDPRAYQGPHPYLGGLVGRYANRIAHARFALDGRTHALTANDGPHTLHGGARGFDRRFWEVVEASERAVTLRLASPDGDEGFPGALDAEVRYALDGRALRVETRVVCDAPTVASLASHAYWNLEDGGATAILDHLLAIDAACWTPVDAERIPTGELASVAGTAFDFRTPRRIGERIAETPGGGYDHNFALDARAEGARPAAILRAPRSGRTLSVTTTLPGLQLYAGACFDGTQAFRDGTRTPRFGALALETQHFPNAPNEPRFPSARLDPGAAAHHVTVYELGLA